MFGLFKKTAEKKHDSGKELRDYAETVALGVQTGANAVYPEMKIMVTCNYDKTTHTATLTLTSDRTVWNRDTETTPSNLVDRLVAKFRSSQYDPDARYFIRYASGIDTRLASLSYPDGTSEVTATWEIIELGPITVERVE